MPSPLVVFAASFVAALVVAALGGGDRNWGYVLLGAAILAALAAGLTVLFGALAGLRSRDERVSPRD